MRSIVIIAIFIIGLILWSWYEIGKEYDQGWNSALKQQRLLIGKDTAKYIMLPYKK